MSKTYLVLEAIRKLKRELRRSHREILHALHSLSERVQIMSAELDALKAEVAKNTTVVQSAIVFIKGLADQIEAIKTDPAALQALADELRTTSTSLGDAMVANTPPPDPNATTPQHSGKKP